MAGVNRPWAFELTQLGNASLFFQAENGLGSKVGGDFRNQAAFLATAQQAQNNQGKGYGFHQPMSLLYNRVICKYQPQLV